MSAAVSRSHAETADDGHRRRTAALGALLAALFVSTALHYAHNYIEIDLYPPVDWVSNDTIRIAILIAWPTLTVAGIAGFLTYASGRYGAALPLLAAYSVLGLATLGHFMEGSPHIGAFWYATIFTDAIFGVAILSFAIWSVTAVGGPHGIDAAAPVA